MTTTLFYLPSNHLYPEIRSAVDARTTIVMVEDEIVCRRRPYHRQKLGLVIAAMREHAQSLREAGYDVHYFTFDDGERIESALRKTAISIQAEHLKTFEISDTALGKRLHQLSASLGIDWQSGSDPGFLTPKPEFAEWRKGRSTLRMGNFYQRQRKQLDLLLDDGKPTGGRWSFDEDNRKKLPKKQAVPELAWPDHSELTQATLGEINQRFSDHVGDASQLWLPTTRRGALQWLQQFVEERLVGFGTYEDAISTRSATLFHSALSPLMNLGLITPKEVIGAIENRAAAGDVPLNDREGIIRQVIGWREFIRGVYTEFGDEMRASNQRAHTRQMTQHWHDGTTGIPPLDDAIAHQRSLGWTHHINRLMVLSNLMNLSEIHPNSAYDYFMTYYIDAYDWVMVPNVYGMGLTSDAGVFATKPYICGSNYLLKMSDFSKGDWCDVVDGLYWRFVANNRSELSANHRAALMLRQLDRIEPARAERIASAAEQFLSRCTSP